MSGKYICYLDQVNPWTTDYNNSVNALQYFFQYFMFKLNGGVTLLWDRSLGRLITFFRRFDFKLFWAKRFSTFVHIAYK